MGFERCEIRHSHGNRFSQPVTPCAVMPYLRLSIMSPSYCLSLLGLAFNLIFNVPFFALLFQGVCTNSTAPSVSSINRILRNRAAERAAAEFARAAGYAGLYHPYAALQWQAAGAAAHLWSPLGSSNSMPSNPSSHSALVSLAAASAQQTPPTDHLSHPGSHSTSSTRPSSSESPTIRANHSKFNYLKNKTLQYKEHGLRINNFKQWNWKAGIRKTLH